MAAAAGVHRNAGADDEAGSLRYAAPSLQLMAQPAAARFNAFLTGQQRMHDTDALAAARTWREFDRMEARLTAGVSERMLDLAGLQPGMRVLDLATGSGEPALRAAQRVGPNGAVFGVDISASALDVARERASLADVHNLELRCASAELLDDVDAGSFDAATARWGLMYLPDPLGALRTAHRLLKPGAPLVAAFWAEPERVAWARLPRSTIARYRELPAAADDAPGAHRYADPARIERDFRACGFSVEHSEEMQVAVTEAADGAGIVAWALSLGFGRLLAELPVERQQCWSADLADAAERLRSDGMIRLGGVTRLVLARAGIAPATPATIRSRR